MGYYEVRIDGRLYEKVDREKYDGRLLWIARDIAIYDLKGRGTVEYVGEDYGNGNERSKVLWIEQISGGRYTFYRLPNRSGEPVMWIYDASYDMILGNVQKVGNGYKASWTEYADGRAYFDADTIKDFRTEYSAKDYVMRRLRRR